MINISIIIIYASRIYSEISHMHVISHRLYKSVLFLVAGYLLIYNSGNQDIRSISIPMTLVLVVVLIINNLGIIFVFTMSTEHLFKMLTIPIHILIIPMLALRIFFMMKIMMKILEALGRERKSYVMVNKLAFRFYILVLPLLICICGDKYFMKVQPAVCYETRYSDMLFIIFIFVIPITNIHKTEINNLAPIRLDQEIITENLHEQLKKLRLIRYNALMF